MLPGNGAPHFELGTFTSAYGYYSSGTDSALLMNLWRQGLIGRKTISAYEIRFYCGSREKRYYIISAKTFSIARTISWDFRG